MSSKSRTADTVEISFADGEGYLSLRRLSQSEIVEACAPIAWQAGRLIDQRIGLNFATLAEDAAAIRDMTLILLRQAPSVAANLIARAADALDQLDSVAKLPIDVQFAALEGIAKLSVPNREAFEQIIGDLGTASAARSNLVSGVRH